MIGPGNRSERRAAECNSVICCFPLQDIRNSVGYVATARMASRRIGPEKRFHKSDHCMLAWIASLRSQ
jgi:hypothetical protein